jgi:hypothetical protein
MILQIVGQRRDLQRSFQGTLTYDYDKEVIPGGRYGCFYGYLAGSPVPAVFLPHYTDLYYLLLPVRCQIQEVTVPYKRKQAVPSGTACFNI